MGVVEFCKWLYEQFELYVFPFTIINTYERGVRLTVGKYPQLVMPGFRLKLPFLQVIFTEVVTADTLQARCVHVTTVDGKTVSVSPCIEYTKEDVIKWIIDNNESHTNLHDILRAIVADYLTDLTWEECKKKTTCTTIKNKLNKRIESMGATVHQVMFTDIAQSRIIVTQI
tara:strand:+ start:3270 stop:3782 length:513 start_codon:yes stop_codon:yes gene_type:complete